MLIEFAYEWYTCCRHKIPAENLHVTLYVWIFVPYFNANAAYNTSLRRSWQCKYAMEFHCFVLLLVSDKFKVLCLHSCQKHCTGLECHCVSAVSRFPGSNRLPKHIILEAVGHQTHYCAQKSWLICLFLFKLFESYRLPCTVIAIFCIFDLKSFC